MTRKKKDVRQMQDHVQAGAHGEHGQDAPQHVVLVDRPENEFVSPKYPDLDSLPPNAKEQVKTPSNVTQNLVTLFLPLRAARI